jgi:hypothetical protein
MISLREVTPPDADLIAGMAAAIYPQELVPDQSYVHTIVGRKSVWTRPWPQRWAAPSFLAFQGMEPVGYLLAVHQESEVNPGEEVLYIWDTAVLPQFRGTSAAPLMLGRILEFALDHGVAVEAQVRDATSFAILSTRRVVDWVARRGYRISFSQRGSLAGESFRLARFDLT